MSLQRQFDILACKLAQMEVELEVEKMRGERLEVDAKRLAVRVQVLESLLNKHKNPRPMEVLPGGIVVLNVVDGIKRCRMPDGRIEYL